MHGHTQFSAAHMADLSCMHNKLNRKNQCDAVRSVHRLMMQLRCALRCVLKFLYVFVEDFTRVCIFG